ncbi:MAG TPA: secondary thiamine-phosphate synthase enzyme YjbQ [Prochlorococcus sp.]
MVKTEGQIAFHRISQPLQQLIDENCWQEGALVLAGMHTTTALIVNEWEERLLDDIKQWLNRIAPAGLTYKHNDLDLRPNIPTDEPLNAHAHLQALLLGNHLMVSVKNAQLVLGQYQDVILVELDGPRQRQVDVQMLSKVG